MSHLNMDRNHVFASLRRFKMNLDLSRTVSSIIPPADRLKDPMVFPLKTLTGPGPFLTPTNYLCWDTFTENLPRLWMIKEGIQTKNEWTLAVSGTGQAEMETACCNLVEPNNVVLIGVNGHRGQRFANMAERQSQAEMETACCNLVEPNNVVLIGVNGHRGQRFANMAERQNYLKTNKPVLLFLTQGESSSGTLQDLNGVGYLCHKYECLLVVDCVAALGGTPMFMDGWEIDVSYSGSQKVLGAPPGASPISFSERVKQKVLTRTKKVTSYYFDIVELVNYWGATGARRHLVGISGGLGDLAGEVWRVGLMGENSLPEVVQNVLTAFEDSFKSTTETL